MSQLKEETLLTKGKWVLAICFIMSVVGCLFPYGQAITPVHEGDTCICYFFFQKKLDNKWTLFGYPILNLIGRNDLSYNILQFINILMFYSLNWVFLYIQIYSVYKIRHNKDRLEVRREMYVVVLCWSIFCGLQYIWYALQQTTICKENPISEVLVNWSPTLSYITIISRDLSVTIAMMYFLIKVNLRERTIKAQLEKGDSLNDLMDLGTVLDSVQPMFSFSQYLDNHKPDFKHLLKLVKAYRQYQEQVTEFGENR